MFLLSGNQFQNMTFQPSRYCRNLILVALTATGSLHAMPAAASGAVPAVVERPQVIRSISESGGDAIVALELIRFIPQVSTVRSGSRVVPRVAVGSPYPRATFYNEIAWAAARTGVDEALIRSVIHAESAYRVDAISHAGAQGLMQLMPATARRFGVTNSFDAAQNILGGATYLKWLLKRYNGDMNLAVAAYNAGEGAVDRHKGIPPYSETRTYVSRVSSLFPKYREIVQ